MQVLTSEHRRIADYEGIEEPERLDRIMEIAEKLRGLKVVHVNSTARGGGVAEILNNLVPLMADSGLQVEWYVLEAPNEFFEVTKKIHNGLQGMEVSISAWERNLYMDVLRENLEGMDLASDYVIVHDPQPMGLRDLIQDGGRWIWRCHIDLSTPYEPVWKLVKGMLKGYDASIFHIEEFAHPDTPTRKVFVMPPSIDPLSPKNRELSETEIQRILERFGIDPERPILLQVGRFDPWKDPFAAIEVYRRVKETIAGVQLLLVTAMPVDDPDTSNYFEEVSRRVSGDPHAYVLTDRDGVGALEVNAFQRAATVALQMSIREGFGLAVAEALWKGVPVVARPAGGIKLQVIHGVTGYLVRNVREAANYASILIRHLDLRRRLGLNGRVHIKENFIITRHLENYLRILSGFSDLLDLQRTLPQKAKR